MANPQSQSLYMGGGLLQGANYLSPTARASMTAAAESKLPKGTVKVKISKYAAVHFHPGTRRNSGYG
jgi:hypothetical protein